MTTPQVGGERFRVSLQLGWPTRGSGLQRVPWDSLDYDDMNRFRRGVNAAYQVFYPGIYFFAAQFGQVESGTDGHLELHVGTRVINGYWISCRGGQIMNGFVADLVPVLQADTEVSVWATNDVKTTLLDRQDAWFIGVKVG